MSKYKAFKGGFFHSLWGLAPSLIKWIAYAASNLVWKTYLTDETVGGSEQHPVAIHPDQIAKDSRKTGSYFERNDIKNITDDIVVAYGYKPSSAYPVR